MRENIKNEFGIGAIKILYSPHWIIKTFWILVLGAVLAASVYLILMNFRVFFSYGANTNRRVIFEAPSQFPQINICNRNPVTTQYGYLAGLNPSFPVDLGVLSVSEQVKMGHNFSDILLSCTFNNLPCYATDFYW